MHRPIDDLRVSAPTRSLTNLIGRGESVAEIESMISSGTRLLTVTGPGGVGKTRLVVEAASSLDAASPRFVHFVPLATVTDPEAVVPFLAETLGLPLEGRRDAVEAVAAAFGDRNRLLVLDNFEHLIAAAPAIGRSRSVPMCMCW